MESDLSDRLQKNADLWSKWDARHAVLIPLFDAEDFAWKKSASGQKNLIKLSENKLYHSAKDPLQEAEEWFASVVPSDKDLMYVYGLGLGYVYQAAKSWLKANKKRMLIFLEDEFGVIAKFFETPLAATLLKDKQVRLYYLREKGRDSDLLNRLFWQYQSTPFTVAAMPAYQGEVFDELRNRLVFDASQKGGFLMEYMTLGHTFYHNFYRNLQSLPDHALGNDLFGAFPGVPAIICGAGPSLNKHIEQLRGIHDKALLFAGGSALNVLGSAGIKPHFGGGIDPNTTQKERYLSNKCEGVPLLYRGRLNHEALEVWRGSKLYMAGPSSYEVTDYFDKRFGVDGEPLHEGHNIINLLIDIARRFGCSPIVLVGMDLSFTDQKSYADGVVDDPHMTDGEITAIREFGTAPFLRKDIYGKDVYTLWKWVAESEWVDWWVAEHPDVKLINATEGGIGFNAVPNESLSEVVATFSEQKNLDERVQKKISACRHPFTREIVQREVERLRASLIRTETILTGLIEETALLKKRLLAGETILESLSTGRSVLLEEELTHEDAYLAVVEEFNCIYNYKMHRDLEPLSSIKSQKTVQKKKLALQDEKFRFLREAVRMNLLAMKT